MSSHTLIFGGFITSLLDDIHVILGHIPYPPRSSGICLFVHTIVIERMSLVMTFSGFHHVLIDATLGHIPYHSGSFGRGWFVQTVLIDDMSHCYDIFGLRHVYVGCHIGAYPSNFAFTIFSSGVQTSSSAYQAFKLHLHMDQMFRLHLHHIHQHRGQTFRLHLLRIKHSDFTFIWIKYSDFICITFASTAIRRSDFIFCISSVQTLSLYGSNVQTSSASHLLAQQVRRSSFVFCISDVQALSSAYRAFRLCLYMDQMLRLHDRTRPGYPSRVPRVVPPSEVPLYNP